MEAKDTIMSPEDLVPYLSTTDLYSAMCADYEKAFGRQAEISFKAGYEERDKWLSPNETDRLEEAMMAGIMKVVEWIEGAGVSDIWSIQIYPDSLQVQKKVWGIKNGH